MKRRALHIIVLLLLLISGGAIVNVAVAWGCVLVLRPQYHEYRGFDAERILSDFESTERLREFLPRTEVLPEHSFGTTYSRFGWTAREIDASRDEWQPEDEDRCVFVSVTDLVAGWPTRSFKGSRVWDGRVTDTDEMSNDWALPLPKWTGLQSAYVEFVPYLPLWPGFAINTIFYAAILWVLFFAPGIIKRAIRRRRGLCPACGYPIGTSEVCTECGKQVASPTQNEQQPV
jgi:hypothetical protein